MQKALAIPYRESISPKFQLIRLTQDLSRISTQDLERWHRPLPLRHVDFRKKSTQCILPRRKNACFGEAKMTERELALAHRRKAWMTREAWYHSTAISSRWRNRHGYRMRVISRSTVAGEAVAPFEGRLREPPTRVPYAKTVTQDCFAYPPAFLHKLALRAASCFATWSLRAIARRRRLSLSAESDQGSAFGIRHL